MQASRCAPPVADAPVEALLARADELARRWAIALVIARPLEQIGEVPLEELAREAPALCEQAVRALQSDAELERMATPAAPGGRENSTPSHRLGALAGARDAGAAVEAVEALRGVLWEALLGELSWRIFDRSTRRVLADLADRLACVCATALAATLAPKPSVTVHRQVARAARDEVVEEPDRPPDRPPVARREAVLVDEREDVAASPRASARTGYGPEGSAGHRGSSGRGEREKGAGGGGGGHVPPGTAPGEDPTPGPARRSEAKRGSEARRARARPLPWDTPLRADRPESQPSETMPESAPDGGGGTVMRIRRGPTAPPDKPA